MNLVNHKPPEMSDSRYEAIQKLNESVFHIAALVNRTDAKNLSVNNFSLSTRIQLHVNMKRFFYETFIRDVFNFSGTHNSPSISQKIKNYFRAFVSDEEFIENKICFSLISDEFETRHEKRCCLIYVDSSASAFSTAYGSATSMDPESAITTSSDGLSRPSVFKASILRTTFIPLMIFPKTT